MPVRSHRRTRSRRLGPAITVAVVALLATGCSSEVVDGRAIPPTGTGGPSSTGSTGSADPTPSAPTGEVTWGETTGTVTNLLPLISAGNSTATINLTVRVLDGLFRTSPQVSYVADPDQGTATSTSTASGQVVDIKIDPDAVWADGQPITAADYDFTIQSQRSSDPADGGCAALLSTAGYDQVERTEQVSSKELRVYFTTPYADWQGLFAGAGGGTPLLSKHVLDKGSPSATCAAITAGWPVSGGIPLGAQNGPWLLTAANVQSSGRTITLVPNPRYAGDKPKLAKLTYKTVESGSEAVAGLRTGSIDVAYPTPQLDQLSQLRGITGVTTTVDFGSSFEHLDFNTRDPLLRLPAIRQALALAVDRSALVSQTVGAFSDRARPLGNRLLLNTQSGYVDNSGQYNSQNIAAAKRLIESAGGKLGADGIYRVSGRPLSFRVMTTQGNAVRDKTISVIASQVRAAGIALTEFANPDIFQGPDKPTSLAAGGFQIALFAWVGSPSLSSLNSIYYSPTRSGALGQNYTGNGTVLIDKQLDAVLGASSRSAQISSANTADRLLWQQLATLPLYQKPTLLAYQNKVQGLRDNVSLAGPLWNSDEISIR